MTPKRIDFDITVEVDGLAACSGWPTTNEANPERSPAAG
jgi:hypothetical protein